MEQPREPRESSQAPPERRQVGSRSRHWRLALGLGFVVLGGVAATLLNAPPAEDFRLGPVLASGRVTSRLKGVLLENIVVYARLYSRDDARPPLEAPIGSTVPGITDAQGYFQVEGSISGPGYAFVARQPADSWTFRPLSSITLPAREPLEIELIEGVTVTGRIVRAGVPAAGAMVTMALTKLASCPEVYSPYHQGVTDKQGRFTFRHAFEDGDYEVYTKVGELRGGGLIEPRALHTTKDGAVVELGDLEIRPGRTLAGRVVNGDGRPLEQRMTIVAWIERNRLGSLRSDVDANGSFVCAGLPDGVVMVHLSYEPPQSRRLWLSPRCASLDPGESSRLIGLLDRDVLDLIIELSPSETPPPSDAAEMTKRLEEARSRTIQGAPAENALPPRGTGV